MQSSDRNPSIPDFGVEVDSQKHYVQPQSKSRTPTEDAKEYIAQSQEFESPSTEPPFPPKTNTKVQNDFQSDKETTHSETQDLGTKSPAPESASGIDILYQRLRERSNLDLENLDLSVYQGGDLLYRGTSQQTQLNRLTTEQQELLQNALNDPSGFQGILKITVNDQAIFHVENGELRFDQYGLADNQQIAEAHPQNQAQVASKQPEFDASTIYYRYQQEVQEGSQPSIEQASIDIYECIAQKALEEGLTQSQVKRILQQDSFYQNFATSLGQPEADRYNQHLLNSLGSQATTDARITALENRVQNLSGQLETLNGKFDRLSQSKAFQSHSSGLNQFLGNVRESISNTLQVTKTAIRQKLGEVALSITNASAKTSTKLLGEEAKDGLRVIDSRDGKRIAINQQGDALITKSPEFKAASEYKRLSQGLAPNLPPSVQAKQVAQAALKENFTTTQIHTVLSESPKFKEIHAAQGLKKAEQFAGVAIAAAQRQNAIDSRPKQQEQQNNKQLQA